MKRKALALAAIMSATLLCSCAQQNTQAVAGSTTSDTNDYVTSSKVTSANSTAASIRNNVSTFLTECDINGYNMKYDNNSKCTVSITVTDGIWTSHFSDTDCFKTKGDYYWENDNVGAMAGDSKTGVTNAANLLEINLANLFPEIQNGYISVYLEQGRPMFVYYTDNTNTPVPELDAVLASEEARDSFKWASGTQGVSKEGYIVGTAPELSQQVGNASGNSQQWGDQSYNNSQLGSDPFDNEQGGNASDSSQWGDPQAAMVTSANSTARLLKNEFDVFMADSDTNGYGPKRGSDNNCTISITVTNGIWTSHISNTDCFKTGGTASWENDNVGAMAGDSKTGVTNAANLLEIRLADDFPDVQNAYIGAYLQGGKTMFVYYTDNTNTPVPEIEAVLNSEEARDSFTWASGTSGVSKEGFIVGTAPQLP